MKIKKDCNLGSFEIGDIKSDSRDNLKTIEIGLKLSKPSKKRKEICG